MRASLYLIAGAPLTVALVILLSTGCTTSGTVTGDAGPTAFLPDGAPYVPPSEGGLPVPSCAFDELETFACPGLSLASTWVAKCVDHDDCSGRVNGTTTVAGCTDTVAYANVGVVTPSCAAWQQGGGALPTIDAGPPPRCAAGSVASFTPTWHPPRAKTSACNKSQIDSYLACMTGIASGASSAPCAEWTGTLTATDQACVSCLLSNAVDPTYGPLVALPTELIVNVPGCIALAEGKTDGSGCGGSLQADEECQRAACLPSCPTATSAQIAAEQACEATANAQPGDAGGGGGCAAYATSAGCAGTIAAGGGSAAAQACLGGADAGVNGQAEAVALAFCGP